MIRFLQTVPVLTILVLPIAAGGGSRLAAQDSPRLDGFTLQRQAARLLEQGQAEEAEGLLQAAVRQEPDSAPLVALLGTAQFMNRRYLAAEDSLRRAVELGQGDLRTLYYLSSVLWENGDLGEAESVCRKAISLQGPQLPLTHLLGRLLLWQARYDEAADWLGRSVSQSSGSVDLWLDLAGALEGAGRQDEVLVALQRAVELAPQHYQVRYGLARALAKSGDREGAERELTLYRRLLEEDQQRTLEQGRLRAQVDLAQELLRQGEAEAARKQLEELPVSVEVLLGRAEALVVLGDRRGALGALEQAVALDPGRADLRAKLAAARLAEDEIE